MASGSPGISSNDVTLQTLRTKKIKLSKWSATERNENLKILKEKITTLVAEAKANFTTCQFRSRYGGICVTPVTQNIPKEFLSEFSKREIRDLICEALK